MLEYLFNRRNRKQTREILQRSLPVMWESLENRQLLSASMGPGPDHRGPGGPGGPPPQGTGPQATIEFSQAPTAVQTGLTTLAAADVVTAPATTSTIHLGNVNGIEIYTYDVDSDGTDEKLTVDLNGNAVTPPTHTTTTFGAITNTAVTDEINAIATALDLAAPISTTNVYVLTAADGSAVYSIALTSASDTTTNTTDSDDDVGHPHNALISVDSNGNPVGHERVPLSVLSAAVQTGLTSNAPTAATALDGTSLIDVNTVQGATLYTAHYTSTGTQTSVTVNAAGTLTSLPSVVTTTFSDLPAAAQAELQALATADGFTGTIDATLTVTESIEVGGTIIYTIHLPVTADDSSSAEDTIISLSVDAFGNPTVPPGDGAGPGHNGPPQRDRNDNDSDDDDDSSSTGSDDTTSSNSGCDPSTGNSTSTSSGSSDTNSSSGSSDSGATALGSGDSSTNSSATTTVAASTSTGTTPASTTTLTKADIRAAAKVAKQAARLAAKEAKAAIKAAKLAAKHAS